MKWQGRSKRKYTGAKLKTLKGRRKYEIGRESADTHIGEIKKKIIATKGDGQKKIKLLRCNTVNLIKDGKTVSTIIENVVDNPANKHYARRNIITKGALIQTTLGTAKVTSRPGQNGVINAVFIE